MEISFGMLIDAQTGPATMAIWPHRAMLPNGMTCSAGEYTSHARKNHEAVAPGTLGNSRTQYKRYADRETTDETTRIRVFAEKKH
jgi:hypothetical protein